MENDQSHLHETDCECVYCANRRSDIRAANTINAWLNKQSPAATSISWTSRPGITFDSHNMTCHCGGTWSELDGTDADTFISSHMWGDHS